MKVLILGSGVIGTTSAHYLAQAGHEVTVIDRQPGPGLETSYANAGELSYGYASPWAGPGIPVKAIKWLLMTDGPLVLRPKLDPRMWIWGLQLLANCTERAYAVNKGRMVRLAEYSRDRMIALRAETGLAFDGRQQGTVQLFREQKQLDHAADDIAVLKRYGVPYEVLDPKGCVAAEPGLATATVPFVGGLRLANDDTGDCKMFTEALAGRAASHGVAFRYGTSIDHIATEAGAVTGVATDKGMLTADAYVVALGSYSPLLLRPLGIGLPVYPIKGYSLTVPITDASVAPVSTVMDETYKVATTRLGDRIRVGGTAEIAGYDTTLHPARRGPLDRSLRELFPNAGDASKASFWCGLRPMTPDGTPVLGRSKFSNLYLNTGHGTLGWTMAAGSGRVLADIISGQTPDIEVADLGLSRYAYASG
ncbi:D-amino acid dehydrogenase [Devosia sp. Root105]|uniref:D-amino acid dehydrogenase n=1 Tax=Devosia sp. Root105 TaxID=1736423 RepID=UPI0006F30E7E|nr:D-amino acid dehydrogenase [Devosia sp. Root105]KQU92985.1 amino acid dehydrogenase [Devosia sp. Root105]